MLFVHVTLEQDCERRTSCVSYGPLRYQPFGENRLEPVKGVSQAGSESPSGAQLRCAGTKRVEGAFDKLAGLSVN